MAEKLDQQDTVSLEELVISNSFEITAMFNILERRGLITRGEFLEEVKRMKVAH
ncbi:hypothetical protein [Oryzomonas sagensis]|uniref:hypothetical protein n=1 Tax=Oryzomonas sagensis TaxID=2603857 RepID=UPI001787687E|nr:hypothetical protein [Oryzomonas sagensis]